MDLKLLKKKQLELEDMFIYLSSAQPENIIDWVIAYQIKVAIQTAACPEIALRISV